MASSSTLQVLIDIKSKLEGLDEATAKMQVLKAETDKLTLAGQQRGAALTQWAQAEAASAAAMTQQAAIESQRLVIAETRAELAAAQIKGDTAAIELLTADLKIRTSTLGVMRAQVLTKAQLVALTEEESALLAIAAFRTNEVAAGGLLAGANLGKARAEAITLSRELATGSVNARTMGALLGSLGSTLTIAGIAGFILFNSIKGQIEETRKLNEEWRQVSAELDHVSREWDTAASRAQNFSDTVKLAERLKRDLDKMSRDMAAFRAKELPLWQKFWDAIATHREFDASTVRGNAALGPSGPGPFEAERQRKANEETVRQATELNNALNKNFQATSDWAAATADLPKGLALYTEKLNEAQTKLDALNEARNANPGDLKTAQAALDQVDVVGDLKDKVDQLSNAQDRLNKKTRDTGDAHLRINALLRDQSALLEQIHQRQQIIDASVRLSPEQKNAATIANTIEEIDALNSKLSADREVLAGSALDPLTYARVDAAAQKTAGEIALLNERLFVLQHPIEGGLRKWMQDLGTGMQQLGQFITNSLNTAIDATANALTDLVFATGNWRQTMLQAEKAIVGSLIKIGLQMIAQKVLGSFLNRTSTQEQQQANLQLLPSATATATAQSGATSGFNWVFAGIAAAAAIALIIGLLAGGFEKGGYTGFGGRAAIAGIVHGQEYVHPKDTVDYYGLPAMAALHQRRIPASRIQELIGGYRYQGAPRFGSFAVGGAVAAITESAARESAAAGSPLIGDIKAIVLNDKDALRKELLNSKEAIQFVIDAVNGNVHLIRKRS